ncbi:protein-arginine deiminase domain-containing protein [Myxococcus sp. K15C18031901]|uniref:protein-arginine deiminase domain-containing protein n=1 Tax=Myxococcus dinghuensis TaxID=2906761 RepID=UPI0020A78FCC|nr:protein-arginine deiminase domain-containing protein [Myxococcus dinghuensis]MCP3104344.1 protein-arginine deiminase domain-containing protein [Myxococcus dinghuensis]
MRVPRRASLSLVLCLTLVGGCSSFGSDDDAGGSSGGLEGPFVPLVDLRADVNRDGVVDVSAGGDDEVGEDTWSAERGAIFLANLDDDENRCPFSMSPSRLSDDALAGCHDAADSVVNGEDDLEDLARLRVVAWPQAPRSTLATVSVIGAGRDKVRLFKRTSGGFTSTRLAYVQTLTTTELRRGVELAIEANDIVRDPANWDGFVDVVLSISHASAPENVFLDTVRMRVAPVVMFHHLSPARNVFVSRLEGDPESDRFRADLGGALTSAGEPMTMSEFAVDDLWTQDYFEPAYMAMPAAGGRQHAIQVNYRAANVNWDPDFATLRKAGRIVFWLRGPDQAAVQQYEEGMSRESQTLNSFGNTEVIPPYELGGTKYPLGRLLRGRGPDSEPDFQPDPSFTRMLEAQRVQPPVYLDTSWLAVAHVDETVSFLPADTPRGWIALVADPALARRMLMAVLEQGHGDAKLFVGKSWGFGRPAEATVEELLDNASVMDSTARAALEIDSQLTVLREETGLTDDEIVRVPFLFQDFANGAGALQPGTVNLLSVSRSLVIAPDPHGPLVGGQDPFKVQLEQALAPYGIRVHWTDTWELYHLGGGEVHCATNSARAVPSTKWWEGGR